MNEIPDSPGALLTIFAEEEYSDPTGLSPAQNLIEIEGLNPELPYHKIFLYQETIRSTAIADYFVKANVTLWRNGRPSVVLPASVGQDVNNTLLSQTILSVFPCLAIVTAQSAFIPTSPAQESFTAILSKSFVGGASAVILGFARVTGVVDRITYNVESAGLRTGLGYTFLSSRALLGILSSVNPF